MALSPEAKARLDYYRKSGALPDDVLPYFYQRLQYAPAGLTDEQIIDHAAQNTHRDRMSRLVGGIGNILEAPEVPFQQFQRQIDEQGLAKVALGIGESIVTSPFRAVGTAKKALTGGHIEDYADAADAALMFLPGIGLGKSVLSRLTRGAIKPRGNVLRPASQIGEAASPFIAGDQEFIQELIASGTMEGAAQLLDYRKRQSAPSEATGGAGVVPPALSPPALALSGGNPGVTVGGPYTRGAYNQGATVGDPYSQQRAGLGYHNHPRQDFPAVLDSAFRLAHLTARHRKVGHNKSATIRLPSPEPSTAQNQNLGQFGGQQSTRPTQGGQGQPTQSFGSTLYSDPFSAAFQLLPSLFARAGRTPISEMGARLRGKLESIISNRSGQDVDYQSVPPLGDTRLESLLAALNSEMQSPSADTSFFHTIRYVLSSDNRIDSFVESVKVRGAYDALSHAEEQRARIAQNDSNQAWFNEMESSGEFDAMDADEVAPSIIEGNGESGIQSTVETGGDEPTASQTRRGEVDSDTSDIDDLLREIEELTDDSDGGTTLYSDPFSASFDWAGKYLERHLKGAWRGRPTVKRQPGQPAQPTPTPNQQFSQADPRYIRDSILGNMLPWTRQKLAQLRSIYRAGYTNMERIGEVGDELAKKLQIYLELKPRQFSGHELRQIQPFFQQIIDYARTTSRSRNTGFTSTVGNMKEQVWDHIESNAPVADPQLKTIAENMKAQWRVVLTNRAHRILRLRKRQEDAGRGFFIHFRDGSKQPWHPILEGYEWNDPAQNFTETTTDTSFSIDDAYKRTERLWMPREYHLSTWETWESDIKANINALNTLSAKAAVPLFTQVGTAYRRNRDNTIFHSREDAILDTKQHYDRQLREAGDQIKITKGEADDMWGHLERARETTLPRYKKDLDLLISDSRETWLRYGIIDAFGQADSTFGEHPGLKDVYDDIKNYIANDREAAVKEFVTTLMKAHPKFETLADVRLDAKKRDDSFMILEALGDIDVGRMNLNPQTLVELEKAGLISQDGKGGYVMRSLESQYNVIGEYLSTTQRRLHDAEKLIEGLAGWIRNNRASLHGENEFVRGLSGITTAMTITHLTTLRNFLESLLVTGKTGGSMFAKSLKDISTDMERTNYAKNLSGDNLASTLYYAEGSNIQQRWLNFTMHTGAEGYSRLIGVVSGVRLAQDVITKYAKNQSRANRSMLEHILIDSAVIDQFLAEGYTAANLETIFAEHIKRVNVNEASIEGEPTAGAPLAKHNYTDRIGDEIRRAANHVSDDIFKQYNAGSLPDFLARRDVPMLNLLFKFKAWGAQQHKWLRKELWYGIREAKQGNWTPIVRLSQGLVAVGVSGYVMRALYSLIAGNPGEDDWFNPEYIVSSAAGAGALGIFSNVIEFTRYADGNSFKAITQLLNYGLGPAGGLGAEIGGELIAGDPVGVGAKILQRAPVLNLGYRARGVPEIPNTLREAFGQ